MAINPDYNEGTVNVGPLAWTVFGVIEMPDDVKKLYETKPGKNPWDPDDFIYTGPIKANSLHEATSNIESLFAAADDYVRTQRESQDEKAAQSPEVVAALKRFFPKHACKIGS